MHRNPLVDYLRTYGPLAASDSIYDEHVLKAAVENGVEAIEVGSALLDSLVENFASPSPRSVILTGTAGDGKTWHCRKVFTSLGGSTAAWNASQGLAELDLPGGKRMVVVKDLSQFHEDPRQDEIFEGLVKSILGHETSTCYLVAANDGQLLRFWRRHLDKGDDVHKIDRGIRTMLDKGEVELPGLNLSLHNLSAQEYDKLFDDLVTAVVEHPRWEACQGCALYEEGTCPIRRNRALLLGRDQASMRGRLGDLIRIAAANDTHLPMRHILVLIVNVLLGVSSRSTTLLNCKSAHLLAADGMTQLSNPYDNVLGLNLKSNENRDYLAFTVFENAGIGLETNNEIDTLLLDGEPADIHAKYVASDPVHGACLFEPARVSYRRGDYEDFTVFQRALEAQRRRLFFALPAVSKRDDEIDPWRLTVFRHGGDYIDFWKAQCRGGQAEHIKSRLVIGLNRSYSGTMCDDSNVLWLTGPAANTQSRIGRILDYEIPVGQRVNGPVRFDLVPDDRTGRPKMSVGIRERFNDPFQEVASHKLSPLLFEYLMRVERGSLPGSFSRQCFEELRQFRLRVMAKLQQANLVQREDLMNMRVVRLGEDGKLRADTLDIVMAE